MIGLDTFNADIMRGLVQSVGLGSLTRIPLNPQTFGSALHLVVGAVLCRHTAALKRRSVVSYWNVR
jgi:hypothetical protein